MRGTSKRRSIGSAVLAASSLLAGGCGEEALFDEAFGVIDLAPLYNPPEYPAGLPRQIDAQLGYSDGLLDKDLDGKTDHDKAEYYDFGQINLLRDARTGQVKGATPNPMYFFFDSSGNPLFSRPVREKRTGNDRMIGGRGVLDHNPHDYCEGKPIRDCPDREKYEAEKARPYSVRTRDKLVDPLRSEHKSDFQRPIIDAVPVPGARPSDPPLRRISGIWRIVTVTVPDGYRPDDIKSLETLRTGIDDGRFVQRYTDKAINCPLVDDRTEVVRGVTSRGTLFPRIEVWYRRKLGYCFLADGWETLGRVTGEPGKETVELYKENEDGKRLDVFDVYSVDIGDANVVKEGEPKTQLVIPATRAYIPAVRVPNQDPRITPVMVRKVGNLITVPRPRRSESDPRGYSPVRWMWDFLVQDEYRPGTFKAEAEIDPTLRVARTHPQSIPQVTGPVGMNISMRGVLTDCSIKPFAGSSTGQCYRYDYPDTTRKVQVTAGDGVNAATRTFTFANAAFTEADKGSKLRVDGERVDPRNRSDWAIEKVKSPTEVEVGSADHVVPPAPVGVNPYPLADQTFTDPQAVQVTVYRKTGKRLNSGDARCAGIQLECNKDTCACDSPALGYGRICGRGIARCKEEEDAFSEWGYSCFAPARGFCYIGCDITQPNRLIAMNKPGLPYYDSRCKGLKDYYCLGVAGTSPQHRFCLRRGCDPNATDEKTVTTQCSTMARKLQEDGELEEKESNIAQGQVCEDLGLGYCVWPDEYEPQ